MFISDTAMPRKKNWRLSLAKKGNQSRASINDHGLVDPGHVNNRSELDPTSDITVNGPLRIVDPGHVKNRTRDLGDTASLKRVQNLPSGANNFANLPSGAQKCARLPSGAKKFDSLPSRPNSCVIENLLSFQAQETSKMVFASVNQANDIFPSVSRGVQCTCNALMAIIQHNANTTQELDDILFAGDDLYRLREGELQSTVQFISKMLKFEELRTVVSIHNQHFKIKYREQIYGTVTHENWNESGESMNLKEALKCYSLVTDKV